LGHWQELLAPCADAFTYSGFQRFTRWLTGLVPNVEEHNITQSSPSIRSKAR
jgi:hypothetical protein